MTDCNKMQANNLACNKISLTEQCKKGELPEGDYFITDGDEIYPDYYDSAEGFLKTYDYGVQQVLAPVPTYEEWKAKLEENTKLKTENKWYSEQLNEAVKKIAKLKEQQKLTSDCRTLAQKLLQVKPELREWLEVNYREYL